MGENLIGKTPPRKEGRGKVTGTARYVDDLAPEGLLYGTTVRSQVARARIKSIEFTGNLPWLEFIVVTAADVPGRNTVALILEDQPALAAGVINHPEEPVLLLAHQDRYLLEQARQHVRIVTEPLPAVFSLEESLQASTVIWGDNNILKSIDIVKGDVDQVFADAAKVICGEYRTGAQEQMYIEPNGMIASWDDELGIRVEGSLQCPYYVQKALRVLLNLPAEKVRVVQAETGGGFGGKEEYPSMIAAHAALLARKARRPVKIVYDRAEDLAATTKRHPSLTRHRTAVDTQGRLQAMDIEFYLDGGAYATLSAVVLSRGAIHAAGAYDCPNVRIRARALATNNPPNGAFRGFGAPQSIFAVERHMNRVARECGLAPEEFRRRNLLQRGGRTGTNQEIREEPGFDVLMQRAMDLSGYRQRQHQYAQENSASSSRRRGIGMATFMHGAGFTGSGEKNLASEVAAEATAEGLVRILAGSTEIGQGTRTIFSQIAGDALGLPYNMIEVAQPDTAVVPDSGPTVASRTCMVVGRLVENAARSLAEKLRGAGLLGDAWDASAFRTACAAWHRTRGNLYAKVQYQHPPSVVWDDKTYLGDAYATYAWAVYVADVEVDLVTFDTQVVNFVAVQEAGHIVHPVLAAGQIEGGVAQGIGFALYEKVVSREGVMRNNRMTNYIIPTSLDSGTISVEFIEKETPFGPGRGAKGIGELPLDGVAPAIINAVESALGVSIDSIPMLPEDLMRHVRIKSGAGMFNREKR